MLGHQDLENSVTLQLLALLSCCSQRAGRARLSGLSDLTDMVFCFQAQMEGLQVEQVRPHQSNTNTTCPGLTVLFSSPG